MKIGQAIRQMRERLELTQEQLALAAGFDAGNLSRIELGRQQPSLKRLISIAHALNVQVSDIALRAEALEQVSSPKRLSEPTQKSFYDAYLPSGLNPDQLEILQAVAETLLKQARK
ncbi:MAG: helix-turn-helix transcriptional regulator [Pigmentiphaga sp.]